MKKIMLALITFVFLPCLALANPVGKVTGLSGEALVRVKAGIPYSTLAKGASISVGSWVKTGKNGWVELTLNDKSKFTLSNNTEFEVTSFLLTKNRREGTFNLAEGKLRASVVKFGGRQSGMTVKSGTAVAGIKATKASLRYQITPSLRLPAFCLPRTGVKAPLIWPEASCGPRWSSLVAGRVV